jgi:hypothetical protein
MVNAYKLASVLYRELSYQGYTASRISGLRPMNVRRAIRAARYSKLVISVLMGFYIGLMGTVPYVLKKPSLSLIETLVVSFFMVFASSINTVFSLQNTEHIKGLLAMLPLEPRLVRRTLTLSLYMTMDLPIYVSITVSTVLSLAMGGLPYPLIGTLEGIPLGIMASMGFVLIAERTLKNPVSGSVVRALALVPIVLASMAMGYVLEVNPSGLNPALSLAPVVSGLSITGLGTPLYVTVMYIALFSALAYVMLQRASGRLFESTVQVQVIRVKAPRVFRIRNPLMALIRVDLTQSFRSRMAGLWALPIGYWLITVLTAIISGTKLNPMLMLTYTMELSLLTAFIPYALYMSELRGAVVFRLLPISPIRNLISKLTVTLIAYYIAVAPMMIIALFYKLPLSLQVPILLAFGPPIAATAVMAILFEASISEGTVSSTLVMFIYALIIMLVEGLPIASLFATQVLIGGYVVPALVMFMVSMIEFAVALIILIRLSRH